MTQPSWCHNTALEPGKVLHKVFSLVTHSVEGTAYADQGNSKQSVWGLSEGQYTSAVADIEAQRRKTITWPSCVVKCTEVGITYTVNWKCHPLTANVGNSLTESGTCMEKNPNTSNFYMPVCAGLRSTSTQWSKFASLAKPDFAKHPSVYSGHRQPEKKSATLKEQRMDLRAALDLAWQISWCSCTALLAGSQEEENVHTLTPQMLLRSL